MQYIDFKAYIKAFNKGVYYIPGQNSYKGNDILYKELYHIPFIVEMLSIITLICPILGIILNVYFCRFSYIANHVQFKVYWVKQENNLHIQYNKLKSLYVEKYYQPYYGYKKYTDEDDEKSLIKNYIKYNLFPMLSVITLVSIILWSILIFASIASILMLQ